MPYVDLNTVHNPATGGVAPAAWGDQIRENQEFFIDPPACSVFHSTTQSVSSSTSFTVLNADSENFDNDAMHSTVSNTSRITAQTAGRYLFIATVDFSASTGDGQRGVQFIRNGSAADFFAGLRVETSNGTVADIITAARMITLVVGDFIEVRASQSSGASLNVTLAEFAAMFVTR